MTQPVEPQSGVKSLPVYKPGRPIEEVQREYGIRDVIKMASNENPLGASPLAVQAILQAAAGVNIYPDGQSTTLRRALSRHLSLAPEQIIIGNGADGLLLQTCMAFLADGDNIITSRSSFPIYDIYSQAMRAEVIKTPLKNYGLDLTAMAQAITPRTRIIFVCNPNNPTGTIVPAHEFDAFLKDVPESILVVSDEAYYEFVEDPTYPQTLPLLTSGRENLLILRTFSKIYGLAGLRLGYGMSSPTTLKQLYAVKEPFSVNLIAQAAGIAALEDQAFVQNTVEMNRSGREYLYQQFDRLDLAYVPSHTNFVLVDFGPQAATIVESLMRKGVIIRPGTGYDLPTTARITIGTRDQNQRMIRALEEVLHATG